MKKNISIDEKVHREHKIYSALSGRRISDTAEEAITYYWRSKSGRGRAVPVPRGKRQDQ